ncbi:MAG: HPr family phosphocarrier protein [Deltaproteobacteria bacterium]|jgi:phosphocarrier protein|nr:HPr family phosphocarrier protein [Deltaproteobacteria bacterium]
MYSRTGIIVNETGLHARPASLFIKMAKNFDAKISIRKKEAPNPVNAKSIVALLALGLDKGSEVEISADGGDEKQAVDSLLDLIANGLTE